MSIDRENTNSPLNATPLPGWFFIIIPVYITAIFIWFFFPVAGNWKWVEAWVYLGLIVIITGGMYYYINTKNPLVIRNRMKLKKKGVTDRIKKEAGSDKWVIPLLSIAFFSTWIIPGLDQRLNWPGSVPLVLVVIGQTFSAVGIVGVHLATLHNPYASKLLDINEGQQLVDTGLYAHVRHPLYSGAVIWAVGTPFALGSWWGLIPAVMTIGVFLFRIRLEEAMLLKEMEGYADYRTRVKFRLIPYLW